MDKSNTPTCYLLYGMLLKPDGKTRTVGGIQSYLFALADAIAGLGWEARLVQYADHDFEKDVNGVRVLGRSAPKPFFGHPGPLQLVRSLDDRIDKRRDIIVVGTMEQATRLPGYTSVSIQHGIQFDIIMDSPRNALLQQLGLGRLMKWHQRRNVLRRFRASQNVVCVDYNFQNWYRTFSLRQDDHRISVIPSFTAIPPWTIEERSAFRKIVIARRFSYERGTHIMAQAADELLQKHTDIRVTFAGDGPLRGVIEALRAKHENRVEITNYRAEKSLEFHRQFDIAIIPTVGSEGTSLSLLEAMAAGCCVICSDVGGMTQVVIDRFNGLMIKPNAQSIVDAVETLRTDPQFSNRLRFAARQTVEGGFSRELWTERWQRVLRRVAASRNVDQQ